MGSLTIKSDKLKTLEATAAVKKLVHNFLYAMVDDQTMTHLSKFLSFNGVSLDDISNDENGNIVIKIK